MTSSICHQSSTSRSWRSIRTPYKLRVGMRMMKLALKKSSRMTSQIRNGGSVNLRTRTKASLKLAMSPSSRRGRKHRLPCGFSRRKASLARAHMRR